MSETHDEEDDRLVDVARRAYAVARGERRESQLPSLFEKAWDDLTDDARTLYVALVRAGYDSVGSL